MRGQTWGWVHSYQVSHFKIQIHCWVCLILGILILLRDLDLQEVHWKVAIQVRTKQEERSKKMFEEVANNLIIE